jgi:hypothetical protein
MISLHTKPFLKDNFLFFLFFLLQIFFFIDSDLRDLENP